MTIDRHSAEEERRGSTTDRPPRRPNPQPVSRDQTENDGTEPTTTDVDQTRQVWRSPVATATPRVSLIIPALNEEKLIGSMLSLFSREDREACGLELIVSDGGSDDQTVPIAREHADVVVVHREPRRQTIAEGRNEGAREASGDLLVFINADTRPQDLALFLETLGHYHAMMPNEGRPVAWACPVRIDPNEQRLSDRLFHGFFNRYVRLLNLIGLGMGRGECQVVWSDDFRSVGGYENHMAAGEDFDLYRRLSDRGSIGHGDGLRVYESPRRFRRFGYLRVLFEWTLNGLAVMVLGRSISKEWEQIR